MPADSAEGAPAPEAVPWSPMAARAAPLGGGSGSAATDESEPVAAEAAGSCATGGDETPLDDAGNRAADVEPADDDAAATAGRGCGAGNVTGADEGTEAFGGTGAVDGKATATAADESTEAVGGTGAAGGNTTGAAGTGTDAAGSVSPPAEVPGPGFWPIEAGPADPWGSEADQDADGTGASRRGDPRPGPPAEADGDDGGAGAALSGGAASAADREAAGAGSPSAAGAAEGAEAIAAWTSTAKAIADASPDGEVPSAGGEVFGRDPDTPSFVPPLEKSFAEPGSERPAGDSPVGALSLAPGAAAVRACPDRVCRTSENAAGSAPRGAGATPARLSAAGWAGIITARALMAKGLRACCRSC